MHHFAPGGRPEAAQVILVLLVDQVTNRASALLWQSRRQTLTALSLLRRQKLFCVVGGTYANNIHESCRDIGLEEGLSPEVLFVVKTDSQVDTYSIAQRVCYHSVSPICKTSSTMLLTCVMAQACILHLLKLCFEPGKSQKGRGLTKVLFWCIDEVLCVRPWSGTTHSFNV